MPGLEESSQSAEQQETDQSEDSAETPPEPADPLDRSEDRAAAAAGLIHEAKPVFAESEHVEGAGAFLAIAALVRTGFFQAVQRVYGKSKVGQVYSATKSKVVKGNTDYWVNRGDGTPLLCIPTPFNDRMSKVLPDIVRKAQKLCPDRRITLVFDRGGADAASYERLLHLDCDFIAYHKNPQAVDPAVFTAKPTVMNGRQYDYAPYERDIELPVYSGNGKGRRRDTGRTVSVREIVVRRHDGGNTHVITSRRDLSAVTICSTLFSRWTQENLCVMHGTV